MYFTDKRRIQKITDTMVGVKPSLHNTSTTYSCIRRATSTLTKLLRISVVSAVAAWLLAFGISQGNVLSKRTPKQQSYTEFLVVKVMWFEGLFWAFTIAASVRRLLPERFISHPARARLSALQIFRRIARKVFPCGMGVIIMSVGGSVLISYLPVEFRRSKADLYWTLSCCTFFVVSADTHTRHIFRSDTLKGIARESRRLLQIQNNTGKSIPLTPDRTLSRTDFIRVLQQTMPLLVAALFAASYVHIVSFIHIITEMRLAIFATCSLLIKVLTQEAAKLYLSKQSKPPTMRSMVIIVATPTIMVDTQLRTVLLCQDSASLKVVGSILLAAGEVSFRFAKTLYVTRKARRILPEEQVPQSSIAIQSENTIMREGATTTDTSASPSVQDVFRAYELVAFHSAETFADMSAEYIAMGCSYAILVLFGTHPKFKLDCHGATDSAHESQAATIIMQITIEIVVDFVASVLEIRRGVNFDRITEDSAYLSFYSAVVAVANIHISSSIYLNQK